MVLTGLKYMFTRELSSLIIKQDLSGDRTACLKVALSPYQLVAPSESLNICSCQ